MRRRSPRSGFALLMALVFVLLAGVALTGLARRSMTGALECGASIEALQRRWAVKSIQFTLAERVEALLDGAERGGARREDGYLSAPVSRLRMTCRLAEVDYEIVVTDEQAKVNVNRLLDEMNRAEAESAVERLIASSGAERARGTAARLRPLPDRENAPSGLKKVGAYGQVFEDASPETLLGSEGEPGPSAAVTCWGDGTLNVRRASVSAITLVCRKTVGRDVIDAILRERARDPYRRLDAMLRELRGVDEKEKQKIRTCLTDRSACHGLWVIAKGPTRSRCSLTVIVGGGKGGQRHEFLW